MTSLALPSPQTLVFAGAPFVGCPTEHSFRAGLTIADYLGFLTEITAELREHLVVSVGRQLVPRHLWGIAKPKAGTVISVQIALQGGDILKAFASIALVAASVFVPPLFGLAAGSFGALALSTGILVAGQVALNALFRPPAPSAQGAGSGQTPGQASVSGNVLARAKAGKRTMGWKRVSVDFITRPLTELVGEEEYVEVVGMLAGPHAWRNPRIGATLASELADVQIETREGRRGDPPLTLVARYAREDAVNIVMSEYRFDPDSGSSVGTLLNQSDPASCVPQWHRVTSADSPDEIWITLRWPEGIFEDNSPDQDRGMAVRVRFRLKGAASWHNGPEIHFRSDRNQPFSKVIKLVWGAAPSPLPTPPSTNCAFDAFVEVPGQTYGPLTDGWQSHAHFDAGSGYNNYQNVALYSDRAELFLDEATFTKGIYEIELIHSFPYFAATVVFDSTHYTLGGNILDIFYYWLFGGEYSTFWPLKGDHMRVQILRVASVFNADPAPLGGDALLAFRGKGRAFEALTAEACGLVPVYDEDAAEWSGLEASSNPADHFRYALTGNCTAVPLPSGLPDDTSILGWREFCDDEGLEISAIIDGGALEGALDIAAAAGHAEKRQSDLWGVTWERDRSEEIAVQVYTPRNSRRGPFIKDFGRAIGALIINFADAELDYQDNQVVVYDDGVDPDDPAIIFDERRCDFYSDAELVGDWGLLQLRMARLRDTLFEREVFFDGRMLLRGDMVEVQDDVWNRDTGSAIVKTVLTDSSGLVTGLLLDAEVTIVDEPNFNDVANVRLLPNVRLAGQTTGVRIRLDDGTILQKAVDGPSGDFEEISFTTPFAMPTANFGSGAEASLTAGCLVTVGLLGSETRRMIVASIPKKTPTTLTLRLFDEAPAIHAA